MSDTALNSVKTGLIGLIALGLSACATVPATGPQAALPAGLVATAEAGDPEARVFRLEQGGGAPLVAHVVRLDLTAPGLRIETTPGDPSQGSEFVARLTSQELARTGARFAVNASYFLPFRGGGRGGDDYHPHAGDPSWASGAVIAGGRAVSPAETELDVRVNAIVCMTGASVRILAGQACPRATRDGVAAGPLLLRGGVVQDFSRHDADYAAALAPRTAIGLSRDRRTAWIVVADGRQPGYSLGVGLVELAAIFSALGAHDAINLDGGGSSTLARRGAGAAGAEVVNRPIHTGVPGRERPVANHILVFTE